MGHCGFAKIVLASILLGLFPQLATAQPVVADPSFETPDLGSGFAYRPTVQGLTFERDSGIAANGSAFGFGPAPDGDQVGLIQTTPNGSPPSSIAQTVTGLNPGEHYVLRFYAAGRPGYGANPITIAFNGLPVASVTPVSTAFEEVITASFLSPGTTGTLSFTGATGGSDRTTAIDRVRVQRLPFGPEVTNPSFETPDLGAGFAYRPDAPGLAFGGTSGIAANGSAFGFTSAPDGDQVGLIQANPPNVPSASISHSVSGLTPGEWYSVRFSGAARPGYGGTPVSIAFNGELLGRLSFDSTAFVETSPNDFRATTSTGTLTFSGEITARDTTTAIDRVKVIRRLPGPEVANLSFEAPDLGAGFAYRPDAPGLAFGGTSGIAANGSAFGFPSALDGDQVALLQATGSIAQQVAGLTPGDTHRIRFLMVRRPTDERTDVNEVIVAFNGIPVGTFTPEMVWTEKTTSAFRATAAGVITFSSSSDRDLTSGIDRVIVEKTYEFPPAAAANPSFELPQLANRSFAYVPQTTALSFTGGAGISRAGSAWGFQAPPDGRQVAFLQGRATISQRLTELRPTIPHVVRFFLAGRPTTAWSPVTVKFNEEVIGTFMPSSAAWTEVTTDSFVPLASEGMLTFSTPDGASDVASGIDMVSVVEMLPAAVSDRSLEEPRPR